jgi:hypothetical protein
MLNMILTTVGMIAVGIIVWRLLEKQGYASPPTDDPEDDETGR